MYITLEKAGNFVTCPLCGANMTYKHANNTHVWACEACPAVLFEYYDDKNINDLKENL